MLNLWWRQECKIFSYFYKSEWSFLFSSVKINIENSDETSVCALEKDSALPTSNF